MLSYYSFFIVFFFFFFQAEDGIRDAQESRGLGDVYKRQVQHEHEVIRHKLRLKACGVLVQHRILLSDYAQVLSLIHI